MPVLVLAWLAASAHANPPAPLGVDPEIGVLGEDVQPPTLQHIWENPDWRGGTRPVGIVGGANVATGDWTEVVSLGGYHPQYYPWVFCTGSLIHQRWVLTAAHCVTPSSLDDSVYSANATAVVYWGNSPESGSYDRRVAFSNVYVHPSYNPSNNANDIALVELQQTANRPVGAVNDQPVTNAWLGRELVYVGFGITSPSQQNSGGIKRWTDVFIEDYGPGYVYVEDPTIDATCSGDSGGPGFWMSTQGPVQVSVVSYGDQQCTWGVDTRVDTYLPWILQRVPTVATVPDADTDADTDSDVDADTDADSDADADADADAASAFPAADDPSKADDLGTPVTPAEDAYGKGIGCGCESGGSGAGWLVLLGLFPALRRRRG